MEKIIENFRERDIFSVPLEQPAGLKDTSNLQNTGHLFKLFVLLAEMAGATGAGALFIGLFEMGGYFSLLVMCALGLGVFLLPSSHDPTQRLGVLLGFCFFYGGFVCPMFASVLFLNYTYTFTGCLITAAVFGVLAGAAQQMKTVDMFYKAAGAGSALAILLLLSIMNYMTDMSSIGMVMVFIYGIGLTAFLLLDMHLIQKKSGDTVWEAIEVYIDMAGMVTRLAGPYVGQALSSVQGKPNANQSRKRQ